MGKGIFDSYQDYIDELLWFEKMDEPIKDWITPRDVEKFNTTILDFHKKVAKIETRIGRKLSNSQKKLLLCKDTLKRLNAKSKKRT